jgi:hypothetical protein
MKQSDFKKVADIINNLPVELGTITRLDREISNGDTIRVWAVEYPSQTIKIEFVFDDTIEREKRFVELLANGVELLSRLFNENINLHGDNDNLFRAFNVTFNALLNKQQELEDMLSEYVEIEKEKQTPTVGENGDV